MIDSIDVETRNLGKIEQQERDPEVKAKPKRRIFTAKYKLWVLGQADKLKDQPGELGKFLRKEGLYSSYLTSWGREKRGVSHSINGNTQKLPAALMLLVLRQLRGMDEPIWGVALVSAHT